METIDGFPYKILGYGRCFCRGSRFRRRNRLRLNSYTFFGREGFSSCRLYPFARQAAHVRCRSDSCSAKSTSSPFGPRTKDLSSLAPRVLAVPGLDARAKKRNKSGFDLFVFPPETAPLTKSVGAGRVEVLENRFLIHKPSKFVIY